MLLPETRMTTTLLPHATASGNQKSAIWLAACDAEAQHEIPSPSLDKNYNNSNPTPLAMKTEVWARGAGRPAGATLGLVFLEIALARTLGRDDSCLKSHRSQTKSWHELRKRRGTENISAKSWLSVIIDRKVGTGNACTLLRFAMLSLIALLHVASNGGARLYQA